MTADEHYKIALKKGKSDYSLNGSLQFLEKILKDKEIVATINLGIFEIPLKKIIGTYSHLRSVCFSKNFLPLMDEKTEFCGKWVALCNSHLNEGINHPIKVYEYLNQYFVIEGNKRVSVLKYFDAFSISSEIIRLVPKKDKKNITNSIYYEFLDFYNKTKINSIWFTKKHSFKKLTKLLENYTPPKDDIVNDKYKHFVSFIYNTFRSVYLNMGGEKLPITTGDAFLEYAKIYGINEPIDETQLSKTMKEFMKELLHFKQDDVEIQTDSDDNPSSMLSTLSNLIGPSKKLKVGFVYARTIDSSGWTYGHELGRQYVEEILSGQISTKYIENVPENEDAYFSIKALADDGYNVIFTTSPIFRTATLKCALEYPQIKFFNCSDDKPYEHMSCYFGRIYEPRFLTGLIAGAMTKTNLIGYSATSPTSEVIASINSFALGAKIVNPYSKVKVSWTREWNSHAKFTNSDSVLLSKGCDIISNRNLKIPRDETKKYGVYSMLCSFDKDKNIPSKYLAAPIWNWGIYYEKILNNILNDTFRTILNMFNSNSKLISFWYGMDVGVVDIYYSKKYVPIEVQRLVEAMKKMITTYEFTPFMGPIYDNKGNLRLEEDEVAPSEDILSMKWFVDNVEADEYVK
ncbi:BMP family ABC transporter substrate-binding protein [Clostridium guangxiense]|uniref:BMP family ABC transporter substrate-binding protein n=1 Tax=Clostridium guangxiense TaxID=1662055 RepID=UPI001E44BAF1|nr:BMP family ABC transporter substrate-binding protein [Clostridium guangxiense]MCD2346221.1 BMP family ABC transporter substrate-binding protein [Clostridium guangxiense]